MILIEMFSKQRFLYFWDISMSISMSRELGTLECAIRYSGWIPTVVRVEPHDLYPLVCILRLLYPNSKMWPFRSCGTVRFYLPSNVAPQPQPSLLHGDGRHQRWIKIIFIRIRTFLNIGQFKPVLTQLNWEAWLQIFRRSFANSFSSVTNGRE